MRLKWNYVNRKVYYTALATYCDDGSVIASFLLSHFIHFQRFGEFRSVQIEIF